MTHQLSYNEFLEQVLDELPAMAGQLEHGLLAALRLLQADRWGASAGHGDHSDAVMLLQTRPHLLARSFSQALVRRIEEERRVQTRPAHSAVAPAFTPALALSLMDEAEVEQGIEQVRIERQIDQAGEWSLRELRALCGGLRGRQDVDAEDAYPLTPALAAEALSLALADMKCPPGLRLPMLRVAGPVLAKLLAALYDGHLARLRDAGVVPAPMRIRAATPARPVAAAPTGSTDGQRLAPETHEAIDRLFAQAPAGGAGDGAVAGATTADQLAQLIQILAVQSQSGPAMQAVWQRVLEPVQRLGPAAIGELQNADHPFWRLLDRIAVLSSVQSQDDPEMRELARRLEPVLAELERSDAPSSDSFDTALLGLETLPGADLEMPPAAMESALDLQARRREIEPAVKGQLVWQLRPLALPPLFNQFLLGPWVQVLTWALAAEGPESPSTLRYMNLVADLMAAVSQQRRGAALTPGERQPLLEATEAGMRAAGLPPHVIQGNLDDLAAVLAGQAPSLQMDADTGSGDTEGFGDAGDAATGFPDSRVDEWQGHAELATVPMTFADEADGEKAERERWLAGLQVGSLCRLMLQGRWVTALLSWRSDNGLFFLFRSRHAAGSHTLTRRALERMRGEGLATSIEPGQMLAKALSALHKPAT